MSLTLLARPTRATPTAPKRRTSPLLAKPPGQRAQLLLARAKLVVPPPTPLPSYRPVNGIDVSSNNGTTDLTSLIRAWSAEHVVVKLYQSVEGSLRSYTILQAQSARMNHCTVGGYVWCYRSVSPEQTVSDALWIAQQAGIWPLPILWLDCEIYKRPGEPGFDAGPDAPWLRRAVAACRTRGVRVGVYTGAWWVRDWFAGGFAAWAEFAVLPHWLAEYDDIEELDVFQPFSGLTELAGKQYWAHPIDLDVFAEWATKAA